MKLVHAADLHLDSPMRGLERYPDAPAHRVRDATRRAFQNLRRLCLDEAADLLVLSGDLWDGDWRDYTTGLFFAAEMAKLRQAGVRVVWIRGNHDAASRLTQHVLLPENVRELSVKKPESVVFEDLGVAVHGQGFASREVTDNIAKAYPPPHKGALNIGLLHTSVDGREGHDSYAPCSVKELLALEYDYWALGHVHRREVLHRDPWVVFPGNLQGRHVRETGAKGATLVSVESGRIVEVEHRVLDVARWAVCEVDAGSRTSLDDVLAEVEASLRREVEAAEGRLVLARVVVSGCSSVHGELVRRRMGLTEDIRAIALDVGADELWIEKVKLATSPRIALAELSARDDAFGQVLSGLAELRDDPQALADLGRELLEITRRLPVSVREGTLDFNDPGAILSLLEDVERELIPRLVERAEVE